EGGGLRPPGIICAKPRPCRVLETFTKLSLRFQKYTLSSLACGSTTARYGVLFGASLITGIDPPAEVAGEQHYEVRGAPGSSGIRTGSSDPSQHDRFGVARNLRRSGRLQCVVRYS